MRIPVLVIRHLHIDSAPGVVAVLAEINMIVIKNQEQSTAMFRVLITGSLLLCMRGQTVTSILVACIEYF